MNTKRFVVVFTFLLITFTLESLGQATSGRRVPEFISRQEYVSMDSTMPFDRAVSALSEISKRFSGKIIIDVQERTSPIGITVRGLHWRDALDLIAEANGLRVVERADYMQLRPAREVLQQPGTTAKPVVGIDTREVLISTIFFTLNLQKSLEYGIDWRILFSGRAADTGSIALGTSPVGEGAFQGTYGRPYRMGTISGNISTALRLFSQYDLGEIIASPRIIVRNGEQGRVQVGQDISIIERTFSAAGTTESVRQLSTGSILTATPEIIKEGDITFVALTLDIDRSQVTGGTVQAPIIDRNNTQTKLLLVDGEEVFISGMYVNQEVTVRTGIPLLKDLPPWFFGLRYIFGSDERRSIRQEFAILLKVEVLPTLKERAAKAVRDNVLEMMRDKFEGDVEKYKSKDK